ncbi:MAG: serine/threonine protein kinase [Phycisphaerales bacterium]|nr:MAG: serine/threonine protein kinase [Phycisphaerales bacterium]
MTLDIPNYRIVEKLGVGAQTRIFRARCMRTGKDYAIKTTKVQKPEDMATVDMMRAEYAIGSTLNHASLRRVYELRMVRQRLRVRGAILFMEYVDGISMANPDFRRPLDEVLALLCKAAAGLHAMHQAGYVHADMKPNNILVTTDAEVKLIDFGQSTKCLEAKPRIQGTPDYMAPEQIHGRTLDPRTDVFGLGATMHKVFTGKHVQTVMNKTLNLAYQGSVGKRLDRTDPEEALKEFPRALRRLLRDCCAHHPDERPADMTNVIERLQMVRTLLNRPLGEQDFDEEGFLDEIEGGKFDLTEEGPPEPEAILLDELADRGEEDI